MLAFTDADLRAAAAPYLRGANVKCSAGDPGLSRTESLGCALADGKIAGLFVKVITPDAMRDLRRSFLAGSGDAAPGSVRSVRWE